MLNINRVKDGIVVQWNDRNISVPLNSVYAMIDNSDLVLFKPSSNIKQVLFFSLVKDIKINGKSVTRDNVIDKFNELSNTASTGTISGDVTIDTSQLEKKLDKVIDYTEMVDSAMGEILNGCNTGEYLDEDGVKIIEDITNCE